MNNELPFRLLLVLFLSAIDLTGAVSNRELMEATTAAAARYAENIRADKRGDAFRLLDVEEIISRATRGLETSEAAMKGLRDGATRNLMEAVGSQTKAADVYLLRVRVTQKDESRALFRFLPENGGVAYTEMIFASKPGGGVRVVDFFNFDMGENGTESVRRAVTQFVASKNRSLIDRLVGKEADWVKHFDEIERLQKHLKQDQFKECQTIYAKLPRSLQEDRLMLNYRMIASRSLGDAQDSVQAVELWRRLYPQDPSLDFKLIDHFARTKEYQKSLDAIDRLDAFLGGDAFLHSVRSDTYFLMGRKLDADRARAKVFEMEPRLKQILVFNDAPAAPPPSPAAAARPPAPSGTVPASTPPVAAPAPPADLLRLRAIIFSPTRPRAMIGPSMVTVGEKVMGHEVVRIEADQVTVRSSTGETRVLRMGGNP